MIDQNSQFFAILTAVGEAKQANATALGQPWTFSQMGVGDANLTDPIPNRTQTRLINEWRRAPVNQVRTDPANPNIIITEQVIPADVGGKWIREIGLYDADGDMVAVANCAPSFKPLLVQGTGKTQIIRMNFIVANTASVVLKIDPAVVLATREWVDLQIIEALAKLDYKHSVLVATTANIVLSGIQTVDGVLLPADSRVLVKDQTQAKDNGIYVVPPGGAWKRAQDADASVEVTPGLFVSVEKGTANGDSVWQLVTDAPIVLGTTPLTFEVVAGRTGIVAGTYRSLTVDKLGRVIAGTNPTTLAGAGITDAVSSNNDVAIVGKVSDLSSARFINGNPTTTDLPTGIQYFSGIRAKYNGGKLGFDFGCSMTGRRSFGRLTLADGTGEWFEYYTTANFNPSDYMPKNGGPYAPKLYGLSFNSEVGGYNEQGGYIGWGSAGTGTAQFICNKGGGTTGGFVWGTVSADNKTVGPMMSYSADGALAVPKSLSVPAIAGNTTVWDQPAGYAGAYIANCAYVVAAVQYKIGGNNCFEAGFIGGDVAAPYMKNVNGTVVRLQVDRPKDTALLASNGWSKNADTGEIIQWLEYSLGDFAQTTLINVTWPFRFPNQFLNARVSFKLAANAQCGTQGSYSLATVDGCTLRIEEWAGVVQTGLVVVVEARGF